MKEEQDRTQKYCKRKYIIAAALCIAAVSAVAIIIFTVKTSAGSKSAALVYLADAVDDEDTYILLNVDIEAGGECFQYEAYIYSMESDGGSISCVTSGGLTFYYADGAVFLEDGTAYRIATASSEDLGFIDAGTLFSIIKTYYADASVSVYDEESYTVYSVGLDEASVNEFLGFLYPSSEESGTEIDGLQAELYVADGKAGTVVISGGSSGTAVEIRIDVLNEADNEAEVPKAVAEAVKSGAGDDAPVLTDEIFRLAAAWNELVSRETIESEITAAADFGIFTLSEEMNWIRENADDVPLNTVTINGFTFEVTDDELAGASDEIPVNLAVLISFVYETFIQGGINFAVDDGNYIYTMELTQEQLEALVVQLIPKTADMDILYDTGTVMAVVNNGIFTGLSVSCAGSVEILFTDVEISLDLDLEFL